MDVSNKFLAFLLVIAIVVTLVGTWYSIDKVNRFSAITGFGTTGYVNITLNNFTSINVTATECNFGSGYVDQGEANAELDCNGTVTRWSGAGTSDCMTVQNDGNRNVELNVSSGKTGATFFGGGTSPEYKMWSFETLLQDGCASDDEVAYPGTEMDTNDKTACSNFTIYTAVGSNDISVGCYLIVPNDAPTGAKTDTWTFTGTAN